MDETPGLRVEPARVEWLEALMEGDEVFAERFGIDVAPGWIGFPEALPFALEAARSRATSADGAEPDPWGSHLFFEDMKVPGDAGSVGPGSVRSSLVGFGGYKGAPVDGEVEVGYAIAPSRRRRGLASAATQLMVERARAAGVLMVAAHTLPGPNPSCGVLERCGFEHVSTTKDPDGGVDGDVWRWELPIT